jgi:hypothetical protein
MVADGCVPPGEGRVKYKVRVMQLITGWKVVCGDVAQLIWVRLFVLEQAEACDDPCEVEDHNGCPCG